MGKLKIEDIITNDDTTIRYGQRTLNIFGKIHYSKIVTKAYFDIISFYRKAMKDKECYFGPFKGEFGHLLLHTVPFLMHLHKEGVKIHFCGIEIGRPFLIDENGNSIIYKFYPLRDFFAEVPPTMNFATPPADVQEEIKKFREIALASGKGFLNIADHDMYWFVYRNWQLKGKQHLYPLQNVYKTADENACVIFPRKKGKSHTLNNGGPWDYMQIARSVAPYFDKVYITGHPSMSAELKSENNIEVCVSADNRVVLEKCSNSKLIITQHSGAVHMGAYTNTKVLMIFNGKLPVKGLADTLRYRKNLTSEPIDVAFTYEEIEEFAKNFNFKSNKK
ncbi:MAG: hypothetical protein ABIP51_17720 [Bacteroidia bacterium]